MWPRSEAVSTGRKPGAHRPAGDPVISLNCVYIERRGGDKQGGRGGGNGRAGSPWVKVGRLSVDCGASLMPNQAAVPRTWGDLSLRIGFQTGDLFHQAGGLMAVSRRGWGALGKAGLPLNYAEWSVTVALMVFN